MNTSQNIVPQRLISTLLPFYSYVVCGISFIWSGELKIKMRILLWVGEMESIKERINNTHFFHSKCASHSIGA